MKTGKRTTEERLDAAIRTIADLRRRLSEANARTRKVRDELNELRNRVKQSAEPVPEIPQTVSCANADGYFQHGTGGGTRNIRSTKPQS